MAFFMLLNTPALMARIAALEEQLERLSHLYDIQAVPPLNQDSTAGVGTVFSIDEPVLAENISEIIINEGLIPADESYDRVVKIVDGTLVNGKYDVLVRDRTSEAWADGSTAWGIDLAGASSLTVDDEYPALISRDSSGSAVTEVGGPTYICLQAATGDLLTDTAYWLPQVGASSAWSGATAYVAGNVVTDAGDTYICILGHTNQAPPNSTYWTFLPSGITSRGGWTVVTEYAVGDSVQESRTLYAFRSKTIVPASITSINGNTTAAQVLSVGTTGTDFAIDDSTPGTHKFNLPSASATARGAVTTTSQTFAGNKSFTGNVDTSGTLYVSLTTHLVGDVDCDSNLNVDGYATVTGSVTTHDSFIGFNNSLGVDAGRYFTIIQDTAVSTWETRSAYNTVAGPPNYNLSFLSLGAVLTGSVGVSGSCHAQAVLSGQVWDVSSFIDDPQPFFAVNDGSTTYRGQWGTDACGNIVAGGLIVNLGSTPISVSKGGTGRTTLDSGQLIAGAGTSAVDSLSETRVVGETIELKLGSDSWIAFSEGSF